MDFEELLSLVRRRLALILILGTLGLALSIYQTSKTVPLFQATATIFVSTPPGSNELSSGNKLGELATGNNFTQARVKSYATIINNAETLKPVIEELGLKAIRIFLPAGMDPDDFAQKFDVSLLDETILKMIDTGKKTLSIRAENG